MAQSNQDFIKRLTAVWGKEEALAIFRILKEELKEEVAGLASLKTTEHLPDPAERMHLWVGQLEQKIPLQYVLGKAWFYHLPLKVNRSVLIPRPETEELVAWVLEQKNQPEKNLLDLCTGSGCIALALKNSGRWAKVSGMDVSAEALAVAAENSALQNLEVAWWQGDVLARPFGGPDNEGWDVWVSNPPYVLASEAGEMESQVLDHEPHLALFVPDLDPVSFYKAILGHGMDCLKPGGSVFFELNPQTVQQVVQACREMGYGQIELRKDMQGKERMMQCVKPLS